MKAFNNLGKISNFNDFVACHCAGSNALYVEVELSVT